MIYTLNIDWLAVYCLYDDTTAPPASVGLGGECRHSWQPVETTDCNLLGAYPWKYKKAEYGTRQFSQLHFVSMPNPEGGWDDFAEIQSAPFSGILHKNSIIVRFVNRALYLPDFWDLANRLLSDNHFEFKSVTRIDICADFNDFQNMSPLALIEGFAAKKYRHIGRGVGALYFNHGVIKGEYAVRYTGVSFGTHSSDARVYLYNKSFELLTQGDKPWIRDTWKSIGLDERNVWRLEVSIKSKGCKFKCKQSGEKVTITKDNAADMNELNKIYHTFVAKLFAFVKLPMKQSNISREPRLQLFDLSSFHYQRASIRNISAGNKMQRMVIKSLWQLGDLYRGAANIETADLAQSFAVNIAESTDLAEWMGKKINEWERPTHI